MVTTRQSTTRQSLGGAVDEDMTDEQIEELLAGATARLQAKSKAVVPADDEKNKFFFPKLETGELVKPYISSEGAVAQVDSARLLEERHRKNAEIRKVEDPVAAKKIALEQKKATAGSSWFNMPKTDLTPELKRDLQLLKMRNVLDPHRHYKKDGGKMQAPEYSQVGTIVQGPTEFFSGRIDNKQRKRTFVEEILHREQENGRFKSKYNELQGRKTSGKKAYYKALQAQRSGGVKKGPAR